MRATTIICVGLPVLDLLHRVNAIPSRPIKARASSFSESLGGMASGAACAIARLGGNAQFWGPVGDDAFGRTIRDECDRAGVDATAVDPIRGARSSHSAVFVDDAGERLLFNYRGTVRDARPDILPPGPIAAGAVLADVRWREGAAEVLDRARHAEVPSVLDAEMGDVDALRDLVPRASHVIFSKHGFHEWAGSDPDQEITEARLQDVMSNDVRLAAVTLGERGVVYAHDGEVRRIPAFTVDAVETLGAGDVFHGAYALAIAEGRDIPSSLRFASAAAALRCTRRGGRAALPSRSEVDALLARAQL